MCLVDNEVDTEVDALSDAGQECDLAERTVEVEEVEECVVTVDPS